MREHGGILADKVTEVTEVADEWRKTTDLKSVLQKAPTAHFGL